MKNTRFKLIGAAVLGLILIGVAVPNALTQPLRVILTVSWISNVQVGMVLT